MRRSVAANFDPVLIEAVRVDEAHRERAHKAFGALFGSLDGGATRRFASRGCAP